MDQTFNPARRGFMAQTAMGVLAASGLSAAAAGADVRAGAASGPFWPGGARLVISISMQFEAGGQPLKNTDSPFPKIDLPDSIASDPVANTWFAYGYREGVPRMLDLWDKHGVKVTSHMIGEAVRKHPDLAREIVRRGHEVAGHGPRWSSQYAMSRA